MTSKVESESNRKRVKKSTRPESRRTSPNILISGTPGTGKSRLSESLSLETGLKWIDIGTFAKEKKCLGTFDETYGCHELDEDALIDELEDVIADGGVIIDHHIPDFYPERFFDAVFILRTSDTKILYDRLTSRGYEGKKLEDNVQCEIFQTVLDEAKESYDPEIVHEIPSNNETDIESNVRRIKAWIDQWKLDNTKTL